MQASSTINTVSKYIQAHQCVDSNRQRKSYRLVITTLPLNDRDQETHLLRITFDLGVLLIYAGMRRVVSHDLNASKMARIELQTAEK